MCFNELARLTHAGAGDAPGWQKFVTTVALPVEKVDGPKGPFYHNWQFNNVRQPLLGPRKRKNKSSITRSAVFVEFFPLPLRKAGTVHGHKGSQVCP